MTSQAAAKRVSNSLKQFRLFVAGEILRNRLDTLRATCDMHCDYYVAELLDEYAIRLLIEWLVTRIGSSVYAFYDEREKQTFVKGVVSLFENLHLYPFLNTQWDDVDPVARTDVHRLLDEAFEPCAELIGALYEHVVNRLLVVSSEKAIDILPDIQAEDKRRLVGQFYTPPHIVHRCYQSVAEADSNYFMNGFQAWLNGGADGPSATNATSGVRAPRLLDPACGTGNFLIGAIRFLGRQAGDKPKLSELVSHSLYGIELDGRAAGMARIAVLIELMQHQAVELWQCRELIASLHRHIVCGDAVLLALAETGASSDATHWSQKLSSFDLVITNPPYVSYGSRNQPDLIASQSLLLRRCFPEGAEYKIRLHSIFQDIALRYCRPGGRAVLLVPDGFLTGSFYGRLRKLLLDKASIAGLSELPDDTIPGAVVGRWCVADYRKKESENESRQCTVRLYSECESVQPVVYQADIRSVISPQKHRFRLLFHENDERIFTALDQMQSLKTRLRGHTGMRSKSGQKSIVSNKREGGAWRRGIKSGAQVLPYKLDWDGTWLHVDAQLLFAGGFDEDVVTSPKIVLRQTGDHLIAAVDAQGLFHLNNVHSFSSAKLRTKNLALPVDLHFAVGLINSSLWLYLYQMSTRERSRPLAQIDIETVECMPIPAVCAQREGKISLLCQAVARLAGAEGPILQRAVDRLVYDLYGLPEPCVRHIEDYCRRTNAKRFAEELALPDSGLAERIVGWVDVCPDCGEHCCGLHSSVFFSVLQGFAG